MFKASPVQTGEAYFYGKAMFSNAIVGATVVMNDE